MITPLTVAISPVPVTVAVLKITSPCQILATAVVVVSVLRFVTENDTEVDIGTTYDTSQVLLIPERVEIPPASFVHVTS